MYLVNERDLKGVNEGEVQARLAIVNYLTEWAEDVFEGAKDKKSITLAGRYIRSRVLQKGDTLAEMLDAVVLIDLTEFWRATEVNQGKRDDVLLYGIFCMLFSEVNDSIKLESDKLEGHIGFAPRLRFDISERRGSEVANNNNNKTNKKRGLFGKKAKNKGTANEDDTVLTQGVENLDTEYDLDGTLDKNTEEAESNIEDELVVIDDKFVTPDNVNKLTILAVVVISILVVTLTWMILF